MIVRMAVEVYLSLTYYCMTRLEWRRPQARKMLKVIDEVILLP